MNILGSTIGKVYQATECVSKWRENRRAKFEFELRAWAVEPLYIYPPAEFPDRRDKIERP